MTREQKLEESCPFCGGAAWDKPSEGECAHYAYTCRDCGASGPQVRSKAEAKRLWNTRAALATPAEPTDELLRLREENAALRRNRCDHCGAVTTGPCPDCGAPQCCPKCCTIDRLTTERTDIREQVERLTRELQRWQTAAKYEHAAVENDSLRAKIAELERDREAMQAKLDVLPADWMQDSSLNTWFPMTAEVLKELKAGIQVLKDENKALRQQQNPY